MEKFGKMSEDFDRDKRKSRKPIGNKQKNKDYISEDQKFVSKAKKAFKNKIRDIIEDELEDEMENYQ